MSNTEFLESMLLQARLWSDPEVIQWVMGEPSFEDADDEDLDKIIDSLDPVMSKYMEEQPNA